MKCPHCKSCELTPTELELGLVGAGCEKCSGVLLPLVNYRYWKYINGGLKENDNVDQHVEAEDSKSAKFCPKCSKLMSKYRIGLDSENKVELCVHCDEAWLDSGEWQLLKSLELHDKLADIFTDSWQYNLRKQQKAAKWNAHFENLIGEQDFKKVKEFKRWADEHASASEIKHYLSTNVD